ncbi:MAG TPA: hypothetical protein VK034_18785, partial [Enhygromyxa sp.]|nr:hypothetical protein [Enhygromyxa sp.]
MKVRRLAALFGLALAGCNAALDSDPAPILARPTGLIRLTQVEQPTQSPHLVEVVIADPLVFVANSNDVFAI